MKNGKNIEPRYLEIYRQSLQRLEDAAAQEKARLAEELSEKEEKPAPQPCPQCGRLVAVRRYFVARELLTRLGRVIYQRHYHYCEFCRRGFYPRDLELGVAGETATPDVVDWAMDLMVNDTFGKAAERLELHHGLQLSETGCKQLFERQLSPLADPPQPQPAAPLPLTAANREQPVVVMNDGSMLRYVEDWGEVKLMSVGLLGSKQRVYLAEAESKQRFELLLSNSVGYEELEKRTVLWLGDGAPFNWNLQQLLCPQAECLVDYWHVLEHVYACAQVLFGEGGEWVELFVRVAERLLRASRAGELIAQLKECRLLLGRREKGKAEALEKLWKYLEKQRERLDYRRFLENKWPIGSGEIESAHRWVLQKRLKQPGMRWSRRNAQRMVVARALYASVGVHQFMPTLRQAQRRAACS